MDPAGNASQSQDQEEEYPRANIRNKRVSFRTLCDNLRTAQREMERVARELPSLISQHINQFDDIDSETIPQWGDTLHHDATRDARARAEMTWTRAQVDLEDFLYYQNVMNRRQRGGLEQTIHEIENEAAGKTRRSKKFEMQHGEPLLLSRYDNLRFGTVGHRYGLIDASGRRGGKWAKTKNPLPKAVGPNELRLWTPPHRPSRSGLRYHRLQPQHYDIQLDLEAIEARRKTIEDKSDDKKYPPSRQPKHKKHSDRRKDELKLYRNFGEFESSDSDQGRRSRPYSANIVVKNTEDGKVTEDRFWRIQTEQGLFISALESSYDWRTSYDYLGQVKSGESATFETSAERDMIEDAPTEPGKERTVIMEAASTQAASKPKATKNRKKKSGKESDAAASPSSERVTASLEYPYQANEFGAPSKKLKLLKGSDAARTPSLETEWAEETFGRREWHVNLLYSPSSPVASPPRSPIHPKDVESHTLPPVFPITEVDPIEEAKRRCRDEIDEQETSDQEVMGREKHSCARKPEHCRAWWPHPPEECWVVQSEQVFRTEPIVHPLMDIKPIIDFRLPEGGETIYQYRVTDHYGIMGTEQSAWPNIGIRVPYESMTFDDMKLSPPSEQEVSGEIGTQRHPQVQEVGANPAPSDVRPSRSGEEHGTRNTIVARDAARRNANEVHSLSVPIISTPQRPWGATDAGPATINDDEESDDEGDLFTMAYLNKLNTLNTGGEEGSSDEGDIFKQSYETGAMVDRSSDDVPGA